ncbi:MAG: VWA domain-containing protein [Crocinitomicaceae bacterium]|nr:VWA domain-containing protein [Crocinitomicaceae bacterium]
MRRGFLLIILFLSCQSYGQIEPNKTEFSFGDLYDGSQTYTDITFTNKSDKVQYLLTIDKPMDVYYIFSGKRILPDSSITIRFKVNDRKKGRFNYRVDVYFSEPRDPITIELSGNLKETSQQSSLTACPDFNSAPPEKMNEFDLVVRVIDSITREPINNAKVYMVSSGELVGSYSTNFKGVVKKRMMLGYYYITAQKEPYNSNYFEGYVNFKRNYVEIELSQNPVIEEVPEDEPLVEEPVEEEPVIEELPVEEEPDVIEIVINEDPPEEEPVVEETVPDPVVENDPPVENNPPVVEPTTLEELPDSVFTPGYFKFNNITFILDVSLSMNGMGKMDLLKLSMIELTKILRPNDIVSMIKYSSEVERIMNGSSGDQKEEIISVVKGLKTTGMTAGGDAIKDAYRLNRKNYIEGGNNIVIMITDGVFNKGDKDYLKTIQKYYNSMGIRFSVVGIKTSDFITAHMKNIVSEGGGDFVRILTVEDAMTKLINEIKRTSFKF